MKIKDIISKLDTSESNSEWVNPEVFEYDLNMQGLMWDIDREKVQERLKCYWVAKHYCTDSYVGIRAYSLDGSLVCMSSQQGRKCDENFEWASSESVKSLKDFLTSLLDEEESALEYLDMEEDLGEYYPIAYSGQFLRKEVKYKGEDVLIVKQSRSYTDIDHVTIKKQDGTEERVLAVDIETPWNIVK